MLPRRIPDYPDAYSGWNAVSSFGSLVSVVATLLFIYIIYDLFMNGKEVGKNPWLIPVFFTSTCQRLINMPESLNQPSETLEWTVDSPIPFHSYEEVPVQS